MEAFGPWARELGEAEARWRSFAALALGGGHPLLRACLAADRDAEAAALAWAAFESLAPLPRRRLLCAYAALMLAAEYRPLPSR